MGQLKCKMDPREFARLGGKARVASQTPEQRAAVSRLGGLARVKSLSAKVRREISGRGGKTRAKRLTPERRSEISFLGCRAKYPGCKRRLKPVVDSTFPLEEAPRAHEYLAGRKQLGKVVLTV